LTTTESSSTAVVFLPKAIFYLLNLGLTGLERFVSIPATVGGATYINMHGMDKFWADYLISAEILTKDNQPKTVDNQYFQFAYDYSIIKESKDIVLTNTIQLQKGNQKQALKLAKSLQLKKAHHPQRSAGCIFQNLSDKQQKTLDLPTPSIGYLMDKVLKLKGTKRGQAKISDSHAGFIENMRDASSKDVLDIISLMRQKAKKELDLDLKLEIVVYE